MTKTAKVRGDTKGGFKKWLQRGIMAKIDVWLWSVNNYWREYRALAARCHGKREELVAMTREREERNKPSVWSTRKHHNQKEDHHKLETDVNQGEERSAIPSTHSVKVSACWQYKSYKILQLQRAQKVLCANLRIHNGFIFSFFFSKSNYHNQ